jgi:predicted dehydrogenase
LTRSAEDTPGAPAVSSPGRPRRWSIGVIGAGQVIRNAHLPVLTTSLETVVTWILDLDPGKATRLARAHRIRACRREDLDAALADVDIVLLAIPFGARAPYYDLLATRRPLALFVEKPFATTVEQHLALCRPYADYQIACGLNRRASGAVRAARALLEHRLFGALRAVRAAFGRCGAILGGGQYHSDPRLAGGGILLEMGVHYLDAALYCAAAADVAVESGWMIEDLGFDLHTDARLRMTLAGGAHVPFGVTVSVLADQREGIEFECEQATVSLSLARNRLVLRSPDRRYDVDLTPAVARQATTASQCIFGIWQSFLDGLAQHQPGFAAARSSLLTTRAIEGLYALPRRR